MPLRPRYPVRPKREGIGKYWTVGVWIALPVFLTLGAVVLWKSGRWLVHEDVFDKVPWAVILAGESRDCERTDEAIRLYQAGRIDSLVLSACRVYKTRYSSEFMLEYIVSEGIPKGNVFEFRQDAYSTIEEARLLIRQFRYQNLDTVLILTSNYHSARTSRIFKKLSQGFPHILVYPAEFHAYNPDAWWSNRESRKYWLGEWMRTLYSYYELGSAKPETGKADFQNLLPDIWSRSILEDANTSDRVTPDTVRVKPESTAQVDSMQVTDLQIDAGLDLIKDSSLVIDSSSKVEPKLLSKPPTKDSAIKALPKAIEKRSLTKADSKAEPKAEPKVVSSKVAKKKVSEKASKPIEKIKKKGD